MYPELDLGFIKLDLYTIMIIIGLLAAMLLFGVLSRAGKLPDNIYRKYLQLILISVMVGFASSMLFQSIYDFFKTGVFKLSGMTFLGGLIGGVGTFFILFKFFTKSEEKKYFWQAGNYLIICVVAAHFFGRIGCFFAGCCYGTETEFFLGMDFPYAGHVHPTQLYEAALLLGMFLAMLKFKNNALLIYPVSYGTGRFLIEFLRGDDRGKFLFDAISPSQVWSLLMIAGGIVLIILVTNRKKKTAFQNTENKEINSNE